MHGFIYEIGALATGFLFLAAVVFLMQWHWPRMIFIGVMMALWGTGALLGPFGLVIYMLMQGNFGTALAATVASLIPGYLFFMVAGPMWKWYQENKILRPWNAKE